MKSNTSQIKPIFHFKIFLIAALSLLAFQCTSKSSSKALDEIVVSILPQKYFVKKITGNRFKIKVMLPPGASPATYQVSPAQMNLSRALVYFRMGVPFERSWMDKLAEVNGQMKIVDTRENIELMAMPSHDGILKKKRRGKDHHDGRDPHIWLSPELVKLQASNIFRAMALLDPTHQLVYEENYKKFLAELSVLQKEIRAILSLSPSKEFMIMHPAWGYFAREFGLKQTPIEIEGKEPSAKSLKNLIEYARDKQLKTIFIQSEFSAQAAHAVAKEIGAEVMMLDPLAENYSHNLKETAKKIASPIP